jgi:hypothetical protein
MHPPLYWPSITVLYSLAGLQSLAQSADAKICIFFATHCYLTARSSHYMCHTFRSVCDRSLANLSLPFIDAALGSTPLLIPALAHSSALYNVVRGA